eukprot:6202448-Pleurochrysis_carterae.AAC.2
MHCMPKQGTILCGCYLPCPAESQPPALPPRLLAGNARLRVHLRHTGASLRAARSRCPCGQSREVMRALLLLCTGS